MKARTLIILASIALLSFILKVHFQQLYDDKHTGVSGFFRSIAGQKQGDDLFYAKSIANCIFWFTFLPFCIGLLINALDRMDLLLGLRSKQDHRNNQ